MVELPFEIDYRAPRFSSQEVAMQRLKEAIRKELAEGYSTQVAPVQVAQPAFYTLPAGKALRWLLRVLGLHCS